MNHIYSTSASPTIRMASPGGAVPAWGRDCVTLLQSRDQPVTKRLFRTLSGAVGKKGYDNAVKFNAIAVQGNRI